MKFRGIKIDERVLSLSLSRSLLSRFAAVVRWNRGKLHEKRLSLFLKIPPSGESVDETMENK